MKKTRLFLTLALTLLFIFSLHPVVEAKDVWLRVKSKNFNMIGNADEKEIRRVATKLEQFREVFTKLLPKLNFSSPIPTTVIVFKSGKTFRPFKPVDTSGKTTDWVAGYFQSGEDINYIALSTEGEKEETYSTIFHEYVHYLIDNNLGRGKVPPWFNEGIAEYYDQFAIEDDQKVTLGALNQNHLYYLAQSKLIPLETFFNIDYYSLHQQGSHGANIFYSQAWAMIHYLIQGNGGKKNAQLSVFLNLIMDGKKPREAFQQAFQTDYPTMEKDLKKYAEQRTFQTSIITFKEKMLFDADMKSEPITDGEAQATLGDLLYHTNRLTDAETQLNSALSIDGNSVMANTAMAMVKMRKDNFPEARKYLEKAVSLDAQNYLTYYRYAYILSREGNGANNFEDKISADAAVKIRESLLKSIALNPRFPESYELLARLSMERNENLDEGIGFMNKALALSPGNQYYQLNLANLYWRKKDFDKAQPILENVVKTADEPQLRSIAESNLASLKTYREQIKKYQDQVDEAKHYGYQETSSGNGQTTVTRRVEIEGEQPTPEEMKKMQDEATAQFIDSSLRKTKDGEVRMTGYLSKIECGSGTITYTVKSDNQLVKMRSKDFQGLEMQAFVPVENFQVGCGGLSKEVFAVLTYLPNTNPKNKIAGDLIAIELVPENYKISPAAK